VQKTNLFTVENKALPEFTIGKVSQFLYFERFPRKRSRLEIARSARAYQKYAHDGRKGDIKKTLEGDSETI
jgi:hypothetical protein